MRIETYHQLIGILTNSVEPLSTKFISEELQLSRSVTSLYLNELLRKKEVVKISGKPVYWQISSNNTVSDSENVFERFIGSTGSAKKAIQKCQAAMLYPPLGMPLLIHGASGVGKSFLAKLIYFFLKEREVPGAEQFFVFNCADYANNPELLSSILFGHTKGAFTGAEKEKKGLLAQANHSILFLDEVHRLSHENQEKLFQFMDTGEFRPIGEEEKTLKSNVRLLFATTENPKEVLLPTFYRRISIVVELPSFKERPLNERVALVSYLFQQEAKRIGKDFRIDQEIFSELLENEEPGNVGSLSNQIRLLCAANLQKQMYAEEIIIGNNKQKMIKITSESNPFEQAVVSNDLEVTFRRLISELDDLMALKKQLMQFHFHFLEEQVLIEEDYIANKIIETVQRNNKKIMNRLTLTQEHVECLARLSQVFSVETIEEELIQLERKLKQKYPRTLLLAKSLADEIVIEYRFFLEILLAVLLIGNVSEEIRYHALLVAHGESTASSIQAVANQLCEEYIFDAINMPLSSSVRDIVSEVKEWLSERDTSKGVIMLVDMGSLTQLYKNLKPQILGELLVINNLTTSFALEIGQQLLNEDVFYSIAKEAEKNFQTEVQYFEGFSVEKNMILSSISGLDVAKQIKSIFEKYLMPDIKVITLKHNDLLTTFERAHVEENYLKATSLILTTSYVENTTDVTSVNLLDMLDDDPEIQLTHYFEHLVHPKNLPLLTNELVHFFSKEGLSEKLEFLNPNVIIKQVEEVIEKLERRFHLTFSGKVKFNLIMHTSLMIERTMLGAEDYEVPLNIQELALQEKPYTSNVKNIFQPLEQFYKIRISDWELYVLYEILKG